MRQFGLGVQNYQDTCGTLPPIAEQGEGSTGRGLPSLFASLIPFLESTPYRFDPNRTADHYHAHSSVLFTYSGKGSPPITEGGGMVNQALSLFIDPGDATTEQLRDVPIALPDGTTGYYATGSYAANGMLPWRTGRLDRSFPDGKGNVILIGERPQVCRTSSGEEVYNLWGLGIYSPHMPAFATLTPTIPPGLLSTGQAAPVLPLPEESAVPVRVKVGRQDAAPEPSDFAAPFQILRNGRPCDLRLPGTPHRSGMQVAMADGSVRVFGSETSPWVFWAACTLTSLRVEP